MPKKYTQPDVRPYLIFIFVLSLILSIYQTFYFESPAESKVLGKGSGKNGDDDDRNKKGDKRKDEDRRDNSGSGSKRSGKSKRTDKVAPTKTRETIVNDDGTTSEIRREIKDGEVKLEIRNYDTEGNKIEVQKYEDKGDKEESRIKVYSPEGTKLSDYRLKTEDGKEVELRVKEGDNEISRVRLDAEKQELEIRGPEEATSSSGLDEKSGIRIRAEGEAFVIARSGQNAETNFPIKVDAETGEVYVETPNGEVQLKSMPDTIVVKATESMDNVEDVQIDVSTDDQSLVYTVTGTKSEKLLGVFAMKIPTRLIYDAQTGDFLKEGDSSFTTKVLDLFSF